MYFLRVYLQNDGNIIRGATSDKETGKLIPDKNKEIWFCCENGVILQIVHLATKNNISFYSYTNIQGDTTFSVRCFVDYFERKEFNELVGDPSLKDKKITKKRNGKQ